MRRHHEGRLAVDRVEGAVHLRHRAQRLDHGVADEVGVRDLAAAGAGEVVVDDDPVVDEQLDRHRAHAGGGRAPRGWRPCWSRCARRRRAACRCSAWSEISGWTGLGGSLVTGRVVALGGVASRAGWPRRSPRLPRTAAPAAAWRAGSRCAARRAMPCAGPCSTRPGAASLLLLRPRPSGPGSARACSCAGVALALALPWPERRCRSSSDLSLAESSSATVAEEVQPRLLDRRRVLAVALVHLVDEPLVRTELRASVTPAGTQPRLGSPLISVSGPLAVPG